MKGLKQGKYEVINKSKYTGNLAKVRYMSSWEKIMMVYFDNNPNIKKWSSETVIVKYYSPVDERNRRYIVDFWIEYIDKNGKTHQEIIECKPYAQTIPPKNTLKKKKESYLRECYTYAVNIAKWEAATAWAKLHGMKFRIVSEKQIFI